MATFQQHKDFFEDITMADDNSTHKAIADAVVPTNEEHTMAEDAATPTDAAQPLAIINLGGGKPAFNVGDKLLT